VFENEFCPICPKCPKGFCPIEHFKNNFLKMMVPELYFVYYSFATLSSWQIQFLAGEEIHLYNLENNNLMKTNLPSLKKAIEDKKLKEHTKQNEMIKYYNRIKK
jgi:hypothetical protein